MTKPSPPDPEPGLETKQELDEDECNGNCLDCERAPCTSIINNWGILQQLLDSIHDIDDKIVFLQQVISFNKFLCYRGECPIFEHMMNLRQDIADFDLPITDLENIKKSKMPENKRKRLLENYKDAAWKCDKLLQEIMKIAQVNKANEGRDEVQHVRRLELIDKLNESHFPLPLTVKGDIEEQLNMGQKTDDWQKVQEKIAQEKMQQLQQSQQPQPQQSPTTSMKQKKMVKQNGNAKHGN